MKKCERCGKPLTEFEMSFHREAGSPPAISSQCWSCSGAEKQFASGHTDKPHHRLEIFLCLLALAAIVALLSPLFPYWNETEIPASLNTYIYVAVAAYFVIGTLVTVIIRRRGGKKPKIQEWDPPLERYRHVYGPDTDIYTTTVNRKGDFVTTKETRMGGTTEDRWGAHASSGSSLVDGASDFYGKAISAGLNPILYLLGGGTFVVWALPYILIMLARDAKAKKHNRAVPKALQRAYRQCREKYGVAPLSYDDKAGFLVSRQNHNQTKKPTKNDGFLSHYQQADQQTEAKQTAPFFYTRKGGVSYMIVDYKREQNKNYGITFVLVADGSGELQKRIVVGNGFLPTDRNNWEHEWNEAGISLYAMKQLDWYERKMEKILKSMKKNSEIVG